MAAASTNATCYSLDGEIIYSTKYFTTKEEPLKLTPVDYFKLKNEISDATREIWEEEWLGDSKPPVFLKVSISTPAIIENGKFYDVIFRFLYDPEEDLEKVLVGIDQTMKRLFVKQNGARMIFGISKHGENVEFFLE